MVAAKPAVPVSHALPIKDTFARRSLTKLALATTARLYRRVGRCKRVTRNMVVKCGSDVDLTEAASMQYIAANTSIPIPKVHCAFESDGKVYIVMERLRGENIFKALDKVASPDRESLLTQLKECLEQMRSLRPPTGTGVQSCVGGSLHDSRIPHGKPRFGPFKTIQEFHWWLRGGLQIADIRDETHREELEAMMRHQDKNWPPPTFTHGDLNPANILVSQGRISGIIDWEFAGWYPHYWEYTSARYLDRIIPTWTTILDQTLEAFPQEVEMEATRQRWWGDV
ncbi:hypothetical protein CERZMDRAFT_115307 [Cercospora zeae-maydis SCOH1-5]|uniref:Aminoglycoside phosphotransferase domain-containing protein n=1 Tax=Cercospora zeae-maydis SCOH1-5 TaxID=717836 RepID=A0A6A6F1K1_9PEZI|nr:hypothetical protein CERZMDRAFT_115307 [Cercospora zeae-maydis SCOH1-5]